ncbi:MAG: UDP-N-acetylmuramate dehydrogenase [Phycisphaeraceae bacterium]|nr:UDP-N-acetylmuramate dehydrogenase [Phycisphaeraceae bacterium]
MFDDLNITIERDVALGAMTWYKVGGRAAFLAHPADVEQLQQLIARCRQQKLPFYIMGAGANLLVRDAGIDGCVIRLDAPAFDYLRFEDNRAIAGAGFDLMKLVLATAREGLSGLQALAGIPATVGGAVRMNAGGAYGDTGSNIRSVRVMSDTGQTYAHDRNELVFSYRRSNIVEPIILEAVFELEPGEAPEVMRRVKEIFLYKRNTQPLGENSAGCAFKNPPRREEEPPPPSAGSLIDQAGLKGFCIGGAEVSRKHANFIVTHDNCKADDVLAVMEHVRQTVLQRSGLNLQREVVVWP